MFDGRTLILGDGGTLCLLACAFVREELSSRGVAPPEPGSEAEDGPVLMPWGPLADPACAEAMCKQAEAFGLRLASPLTGAVTEEDAGARETMDLLAATFLAARMGCRRVFWPASGAVGENINLDRVAAIADAALLVGRLVALQSAGHGMPGIHVHVPFVDLTDRQIVDLVEDMALPLEACWWWGSGQAEERRWREATNTARGVSGGPA